jgi:hypothetical protein
MEKRATICGVKLDYGTKVVHKFRLEWGALMSLNLLEIDAIYA